MDDMGLSCRVLEKIWRPCESQTRYLQSSPPDTMRSLTALHARHITVPSWALHYIVNVLKNGFCWRLLFTCSGFVFGANCLIIISLPCVYPMAWLSGDQQAPYIGVLLDTTVDLSIPLFDQTFISPSSPPVEPNSYTAWAKPYAMRVSIYYQ